MSEKKDIVRRCENCPEWTQTVCRHAFGAYWRDKSGDGTGCRYPLDEVAEAWRKAGWKPGKGESIPIVLPAAADKKPAPPPPKPPPPKPAAKRNDQPDLFAAKKSAAKNNLPPLTDDDY